MQSFKYVFTHCARMRLFLFAVAFTFQPNTHTHTHTHKYTDTVTVTVANTWLTQLANTYVKLAKATRAAAARTNSNPVRTGFEPGPHTHSFSLPLSLPPSLSLFHFRLQGQLRACSGFNIIAIRMAQQFVYAFPDQLGSLSRSLSLSLCVTVSAAPAISLSSSTSFCIPFEAFNSQVVVLFVAYNRIQLDQQVQRGLQTILVMKSVINWGRFPTHLQLP